MTHDRHDRGCADNSGRRRRGAQQYTVQVAPPIEVQAYPATTVQVISATQLPSTNTLAGDQPVREEVKKVVRHFKIVKVDPDGSEGARYALPDDTLEKMPALLKRFIKSLPNGRYRIYLVEGDEGGVQTERLIREFYKSGKSLGDPVHEIGPGSIEGQDPETPSGGMTPTPGGASHTDGKTSQGRRTALRLAGAFKSQSVQAQCWPSAPWARRRCAGIGSSRSIRPWKAAWGGHSAVPHVWCDNCGVRTLDFSLESQPVRFVSVVLSPCCKTDDGLFPRRRSMKRTCE